MTPPRILIFSLAYFPFVGGAEVAIKEITDRLPNWEFDLITTNLNGREKRDEKIGLVNVLRLGRGRKGKYLFPIVAVREAVKNHKIKPYEAIWAIMANQAGMAGALFKRRFLSVPFLLTLQEGDDLNSLAYRWRLLLPRFFGVFRRPDQITAISNYLARWAREMRATCPITVVPNGVDLGKFNSLVGEQGNQRPDLKEIPRSGLGQKTIITTSRLVKKNGVDTLIESLRFLPDNVRLQILGSGPEKMSLGQLMSRLSLDKRIEFLGQVPPDQIPNYLARADVFVRPSRSEGLGNSFLEAMVAGVPVVGTPVGGIPDFLMDPDWQGETLPDGKVSPLNQMQTGWFCEVNNSKSVAEKVEYILNANNHDKVVQIISNAKKLVQEKYDWDKIALKISHIFEKMMTRI